MRSFILFTIILCDQIKGDEMERWDIPTEDLSEIVKERDHWKRRRRDLKERGWQGADWIHRLRIGGTLPTLQWPIGVHVRQESFWLAKRLSVY
jgi:hypothetical protein